MRCIRTRELRFAYLLVDSAIFVLTTVGTSDAARGDLILNSVGTAVLEDFSGFTGTGFAPNPSAGQLDSDSWRVIGLSDGDSTFGGTFTSGDFARGASAGGVSTGGVYAFDVGGGDIGSRDTALGVQPTAGDFNPGVLILRVMNATGVSLDSFTLSFDALVLNNENRSGRLSVSLAGASYTGPTLEVTSPADEDASPIWSSTSLLGTFLFDAPVADGDTFLIHFAGDDLGSAGSRDEFAIDNVSVLGNVTAVPEPTSLALLGIPLVCGAAYRRVRSTRSRFT